MKTAKEILSSTQLEFGKDFPNSESEKKEFRKWAEDFLNSETGREMLLFIDSSTSIVAIKDKKGFIIRTEKAPGLINLILEYPKRK